MAARTVTKVLESNIEASLSFVMIARIRLDGEAGTRRSYHLTGKEKRAPRGARCCIAGEGNRRPLRSCRPRLARAEVLELLHLARGTCRFKRLALFQVHGLYQLRPVPILRGLSGLIDTLLVEVQGVCRSSSDRWRELLVIVGNGEHGMPVVAVLGSKSGQHRPGRLLVEARFVHHHQASHRCRPALPVLRQSHSPETLHVIGEQSDLPPDGGESRIVDEHLQAVLSGCFN